VSRILKYPRGSSGGVVPRKVFDASKEAERILAEAQAQAQTIVAEAEAVREAARQQGFEEGRQEGLAQVTQTLRDAALIRENARRDAARDLSTLAVRIAEKVIGRVLEQQPEVIAHIVAEALEAARHQRDIIVRVNPQDLATIEQARPHLVTLLERAPDLKLRSDPTIGRGGCIVETEVGVIDARLETQLQAIERALLAASGVAAPTPEERLRHE